MTITLNARVGEVTERIARRSRTARKAYLDRIDHAVAKGPSRKKLGCANLAHGFAGCVTDQGALRDGDGPNLAIVTAYNDMLSAHQPFQRFPDLIKQAARAVGGTAQVAGGVPAMCDGITQGEAGMGSRCRRRSRSRTTCSTRRSISASATRSCRVC
jgi:phosphogluconate dehydratase